MTAATETTNIAAHGGTLVNRIVPPDARKEARARAAKLRAVPIGAREASELLLIATGAFSPLEGFQTKAAAQSVVDKMSLPDGTLWPLPILLHVVPAEAKDVRVGERVALVLDGEPLATLDVEDIFTVPSEEWAPKIFGTSDAAHPGVAALRNAGEIALGGKIEWLGDPTLPGLTEKWQTPEQTRAEIRSRGWATVAGFQTRNPVHRAHEHVLRIALEVTDGLLLHPLVGETRAEDIPADIRMRCYQALLDNYLPQKYVLFTTLPAFMRYAGPREAIFHALVRKNFGCTHFLVGRDHAGVGGYYGPYDAHKLVKSVIGRGLGVQPIFFDEVFYCNRCGSMASRKTCTHPDDAHLSLSGTEVRRRLREGLPLPVEFTRPEVAAVLSEAFRETAEAGQETRRA